MRYFILLCACLLVSCNTKTKEQPTDEVETTTYYLIRHAEKETHNPDDKNPPLTEEGQRRAKDWAEAFRDIPIELIYSTRTKRTLETAAPIAESKDLEIALYGSYKDPIEKFLKESTEKNILIVGHSNTISEMANTIIGKEKFTPLSDDTYDLLFILVKQGNHVQDVVIKMP